MPDVTASYGMPFDFIAFFGHFHTLLSELLYLYKTFTNYVSNQYRHTDISTCPDVTASYGIHLDFIMFFANFSCN